MSYCTVDDIGIALQKQLVEIDENTKKYYHADSQPTEAQVTSIIERFSNIIDGALKVAGITLPVTSSILLSILQHQNINGAAGYISGTYIKNADGSTQYNAYSGAFDKFLQDVYGNPRKYNAIADENSADVPSSFNNVSAGYLTEKDLDFMNEVRFP